MITPAIFTALSLSLITLFYAPSWSFPILSLSVLCGMGGAYLARIKSQESPFSDTPSLLVMLGALLIFALPFYQMGDSGHLLITKTFFSDHLKHNAITAALIEPGTFKVNPYLADSALWYHYLAYIPGALILKFTSFPVYQINRWIPLLYLAIFLCSLWSFMRCWIVSRRLWAACALVLIASSYDMVYVLFSDEKLLNFISAQPDLIWEWAENDFVRPSIYTLERGFLYLWPHIFSISLLMGALTLLRSHPLWPILTPLLLGGAGLSSLILGPSLILIFSVFLLYEKPVSKHWLRYLVCLSLIFLILLPYYYPLYVHLHILNRTTVNFQSAWSLFYQRSSWLTEAMGFFNVILYLLFEWGGSLIVCVFGLGQWWTSKQSRKKIFWLALIWVHFFLMFFFHTPGTVDWAAKHSILFALFLKLTAIVVIWNTYNFKAKTFYVCLMLLGSFSFAANIAAYTDSKKNSAVYSPKLLSAATWINKNIPRGNRFQTFPGNTFFMVSVVGRPLAVGDGHHAFLFGSVPWQAAEVLNKLEPQKDSHYLNNLCAFSVDYLWREPHKWRYKSSEAEIGLSTVFQNEAGRLDRLQCPGALF